MAIKIIQYSFFKNKKAKIQVKLIICLSNYWLPFEEVNIIAQYGI
jgi:hypothetical protein